MNEQRLSQVLSFVDGHVKFAETKNAALLTLSCAGLLGIAQLLYSATPPISYWRCYCLLVGVGLLCAGVLALLSFLPATQIPWIRRRPKRERAGNLLFFGDAQRFDGATYLETLSRATGERVPAANGFERMYAEQIIANAKIAARKFTYFKLGLWSVLFGVQLCPKGLRGEPPLVQFIVDTTGRADTTQYRELNKVLSEVVRAFRRMLPALEFVPAKIAGRSVRQLVQMQACRRDM